MEISDNETDEFISLMLFLGYSLKTKNNHNMHFDCANGIIVSFAFTGGYSWIPISEKELCRKLISLHNLCKELEV